MRVTVILHERLGNWNRQLRPRLSEHPVRWFESRSPADLEVLLEGLAFPVVLIDLARQPVDGLTALEPGLAPRSRRAVPGPRSRGARRRSAAWPASWERLTSSRASCRPPSSPS